MNLLDELSRLNISSIRINATNEVGRHVSLILQNEDADRLIEEVKLLKRENNALASDNELRCDEIAKLRKENSQLLERIKRLES